MSARVNKNGPVSFRGEVVASNGMVAKLNYAAIDMFETTYDVKYNLYRVELITGIAKISDSISLLHCCLVKGGNDVTRDDAADLLSDDSDIVFELFAAADPQLRAALERELAIADAKLAKSNEGDTKKKPRSPQSQKDTQ